MTLVRSSSHGSASARALAAFQRQRRRRGADSQSAASRLLGTRFGARPAGVPMSRDAAGTSAGATSPTQATAKLFLRWRLLQWLLDLEDAIGGNVPELLYDSGRPEDFHQVRGLARAQTEVGGTRARRGVSGSERNVTVLRDSACYHLESCPDPIAVAFGAFQCEFDPVMATRAVVEPHFSRCAESRDNY